MWDTAVLLSLATQRNNHPNKRHSKHRCHTFLSRKLMAYRHVQISIIACQKMNIFCSLFSAFHSARPSCDSWMKMIRRIWFFSSRHRLCVRVAFVPRANSTNSLFIRHWLAASQIRWNMIGWIFDAATASNCTARQTRNWMSSAYSRIPNGRLKCSKIFWLTFVYLSQYYHIKNKHTHADRF